MGSVGNLKGLFALAKFLKPWDWLFLAYEVDEEGRRRGSFGWWKYKYHRFETNIGGNFLSIINCWFLMCSKRVHSCHWNSTS